ncbi:SGNH/GDSL hydrolase family protein [Pectobacterium versatile]|uniref:SGNH/GDSL hydrolase family protein n=1 Tax=Pectobacterium versatile TaxID=2488639 RepID=UPI002DD43D5D|nr:SGNH/GDSL hydrolase family protein [Pectobacterium versatile]
MRFTLAGARDFKKFSDGQKVYLTDVGYTFVYNSSRNLLNGHPESEIKFDDELHKIITSGGMLEFDDYHKLRELESRNYAEYQARLRAKQPIGMVAYGDSITYGLRADGGQYANNYPAVVAQTLSELTGVAFTSQNQAFAGDRALTNYIRNIADGTNGHISTIMIGINDVLYATNNGETPSNISGGTLYSAKNYGIIMRKFVARELLRGRCVVVIGGTQFVSHNLGPMGVFTAPYLDRTYDTVTRCVADEFGCAFIDTRRDITQQFGISESCHDGLHLSDSFLDIIGKRFAAFFMNQDFKNPYVMRAGSVLIPNFLHNAISSNRPLLRNTFTDGSSPPLGGAVDNPEATGFMLPNDNLGGVVTIAFYLDIDNAVIFPTINCKKGRPFSFDLIINRGAKQADYPSDVEIIPALRDRDKILSGRSVSGDAPKNRTTEKYSKVGTACCLHITTRGWHMVSFAVGQNAGEAAVEGIVCDTWSNVRNNDVYGGISGTVFRRDATNTVTGFVTGCKTEAVGVFDVAIDNLTVEAYKVDVEYTEDASLITHRVVFKSSESFRIMFFNAAGALVNPISFKATVTGGR